MSDIDLKVVVGKRKRDRFPVSVLVGSETVATAKIDPFKPEQISAFVEQCGKAMPGLNGELDELRQRLLNLAQPRPTAQAGEDDLVFDPRDPLPIAREFRRRLYWHPNGPTLYCHDGIFNWFDGTKYIEMDGAAVRSKMYAFLESAKKWGARGEDAALVDFQPSQTSVNDAIDALRAVSYLAPPPPAWLDDDPTLPNPTELLSTPTGLLHLPLEGQPRIIRRPTPLFYSLNALDYVYDPDVIDPVEWLKFLDVLWPDDPESIALLQEWFGLCLLPITRYQKMLLLVGPPRSGKGTIARVLSKMIGLANCCGPTLSGIGGNFGLWSLIGKLLAVISDARLSGRTDLGIIVERLLSISGEDLITVDRKNMAPVTVRLFVRVMVLTNEIPRLADSSGALANRFMVLLLEKSFLGCEDLELEDRLMRELPSILKWALAGLQRLRDRGRFVQPGTAQDAVEDMLALGSPIKAFISDWCRIDPAAEIDAAALFEAWRIWCHQQGREGAGTVQTFGRDLRAAVPGVGMSRPRRDGDGYQLRQRVYRGIALTPAGSTALSIARAKKEQESNANR